MTITTREHEALLEGEYLVPLHSATLDCKYGSVDEEHYVVLLSLRMSLEDTRRSVLVVCVCGNRWGARSVTGMESYVQLVNLAHLSAPCPVVPRPNTCLLEHHVPDDCSSLIDLS